MKYYISINNTHLLNVLSLISTIEASIASLTAQAKTAICILIPRGAYVYFTTFAYVQSMIGDSLGSTSALKAVDNCLYIGDVHIKPIPDEYPDIIIVSEPEELLEYLL